MLESQKKDLYRLKGSCSSMLCFRCLLQNRDYRFLYFYRGLREYPKGLRKLFAKTMYCLMYRQSGIELPWQADIGPGFTTLHTRGITINSKTKAGKNLTMLKGSTIGSIHGGKKDGTPVIGDNVYIGLNATVVGKIVIGDDVLIAPNAYVNFDVPSHSVVIGNPGVIHKKMDATLNYINYPVE